MRETARPGNGAGLSGQEDTMNATVTLSAYAVETLEAAYIVPQRQTTNRRAPWVEELLRAGFVTEQPGIGLVITDAGRAYLTARDKA